MTEPENPYAPPATTEAMHASADPGSHPNLRWRWALLGYALFASPSIHGHLAGLSNPSPVSFAIDLAATLLLTFLGLIAAYGALWFHLAGRVLGATTSLSASLRLVGCTLVQPGLVATLLMAARLLVGGAQASDSPSDPLRGLQLVVGLWALVAIVATARREHSFRAAKTAFFVLWAVVVLVLVIACRIFLSAISTAALLQGIR